MSIKHRLAVVTVVGPWVALAFVCMNEYDRLRAIGLLAGGAMTFAAMVAAVTYAGWDARRHNSE